MQPLANLGRDEEPVPVVDFGAPGPLRCGRCKAYVNPFFKFVDGGRSFVCNLCDMKCDVPREYQCNLDANGQRRDRTDRAELCHGSVDFAVAGDYIMRPIADPCHLFLVDVSYSSAITGLLHVAVQAVRNCLDAIAANPRARVGVVTFDAQLQVGGRWRVCV
jgi:protein transport protein SEC24